jgi:hypothetical protein
MIYSKLTFRLLQSSNCRQFHKNLSRNNQKGVPFNLYLDTRKELKELNGESETRLSKQAFESGRILSSDVQEIKQLMKDYEKRNDERTKDYEKRTKESEEKSDKRTKESEERLERNLEFRFQSYFFKVIVSIAGLIVSGSAIVELNKMKWGMQRK